MEIVLIAPPPTSSPRALRPHRELLIAWTLLLLEDDELHGYRLHQALAARGVDLQTTSLYRCLNELERDRRVTARWAQSIGGPRRHVYRLTPEGRSTLHELNGLIAAVRDTYGTFLHAHRQALAGRIEGVHRDIADEPRAPHDAVAAVPTLEPLRPHKELLVGWLLLHIDAGATYGYDLLREFDADGLSIDRTVLYRMLRRLEADRWVQSRWLPPAAGPRRRFYRLTTRGRRNLDEIADLVAAIRDSHDAYLGEYEHAPPSRD